MHSTDNEIQICYIKLELKYVSKKLDSAKIPYWLQELQSYTAHILIIKFQPFLSNTKCSLENSPSNRFGLSLYFHFWISISTLTFALCPLNTLTSLENTT